MQTFNPLTIPLAGQQLIEASAGTGKTYSIALLFLRLIIEGGLEVDKILVVTFTTSATEELRLRIRARLREALDILERSGNEEVQSGDRILQELLGPLANRREAAQRLTDALARMDESAVFTIHSFCQRMLQENAFESGVPFDTEFIENEQQLRLEIVRDFWRQRFYSAPAAEAAWATATWKDPEGLAGVLEPLLRQSGVLCIPEVSADDLHRLREESREHLRAVRRCWEESGAEVSAILRDDQGLSRDKKKGYGAERVELALAAMDMLASMDEDPWLLPEAVELLAASVMAEKVKKNKQTPGHRFFALFEAFYRANNEALRLARIRVIHSAHAFLRDELDRRKRDRAQMYFDDLLTRMDRALAGPDGAGLAQRIQNRFAVALVDEFQDTDPLQYRIFHTLFGAGARPGLFMIGDPKQSIYSFRGADIFAYIRAKKDTPASAAFTMDTNYRSTSAMVGAVNRLFDREASFIFDRDIHFNPVRSAGKAEQEPFVVRGAEPEPLQAMILPVDDFAAGSRKEITKGRAEQAASRWTAMEIARLLRLGAMGEAGIGSRPLAGGDLAVLVRTHREAEMIQKELTRLRITSVYYSQDSVFVSDEARELHLFLTSLLDLSAASRVNLALATPLFGLDAQNLEQLQSDADKWDRMIAVLEGYHLCWRGQGVAAMLQKLLAEQRVVQRLIALPGGERKLTNILHLSELLQEASGCHAAMDCLVRWLAMQRRETGDMTASRQLRLESDENLVRIVTVHKAKGLEYPVVFLPFVWSCRPVRAGDIISFHHPRSQEYIVDLGTDEQEHYLQAERERLAEDLRLLYVAITRARYCCYFSWGRIKAMDRSAMAWLLHREGPGQDQWPVYAELTEERIRQDLAGLNEAGVVLGHADWPHEAGEQSLFPGIAPKPLAAGIFRGRIDTGWTISSYSRMVRTAVHATPVGEVEFTPVAADAGAKDRTVFNFPRGPAAGTCLHGIFERLDFAGYSAEELQAITEEELRKTGLERDWAPLVCNWVGDVLKTPLDAFAGLQLQHLAECDRLVEMGFYFAMRELDIALLNRVLADYGYIPVEVEEEALTGLMKGYIDLVFRRRDRYFLADYKSNYLGPGPEGYRGNMLEQAMREHRYDLQYLIYVVALHRYLGSRIRGYDYTLHFGGVYYLFLRGMHPDHPPGHGVYSTMPPRELVMRLDACFGSMEKR
ncbi:MAG: exodeoxyribonuclease V subunit beta [Desulfobulbaceae bacterium]|nr:exodeoxyribonuclease V subunit beta [Desulfobulbaceae bacterium]